MPSGLIVMRITILAEVYSLPSYTALLSDHHPDGIQNLEGRILPNICKLTVVRLRNR